ncbi:nicotinamide riboside transporter PnuC [Chryseobacterium antibioticum]|uniref:Nicotinamide riboside transporter PnuC n=1 Tax=Chryseobacterium pyrolae TaxID=2987481 RepID=A0ABT2ILF9_9FLAO|nr:nicotinamide riboside transporter PnuC [Chryseobacterium pyrolae]MCT2409489.1 nicotinamide riboside transporter PnuC [Chryseobacterium pyrolae]
MKNILKSWKPFEIIWLLSFSLLGAIIAIVSKDNWLNFLVLVSGILCVVLAAKGSIWNYVIGTLNTVAYAYVAYTNGLFGELGLYILFFFPMNIIGYFMWKNHVKNDIVDMKTLNIRSILIVFLITVLGCIFLGYFLSTIHNQNNPYLDGMSTVISIIATILMILRYKEQWLLYIILNIITVIIWVIRTLHGSESGIMMIAMWSAFLINAVYGYYNWNKGSKELK